MRELVTVFCADCQGGCSKCDPCYQEVASVAQRSTFNAHIVPSKKGLTIQFTLEGEMEQQFRAMMNIINDYDEDQGDACIIKSMDHVLRIAFDAVDLIERHKKRLY